MYKNSDVVYRLANGVVVNTLVEARGSGLHYSIDYIPRYEEIYLDTDAKAKRLVALALR